MDELDEIRGKKLKELRSRHFGNKEVFDHPVPIQDSTIDNFLKTHPAIVIDFWASWCGPCLTIAPIVEALARDYSGKVVFGKLNVDENRTAPSKYGISAIPTLLFFKNGRLVDRVVGALPRKQLEERIRRIV